MKPVISSAAEEIRIQIGSNHYPTLRQLPDGWVLEVKPDRMPLLVTCIEVVCALLVALVVIRQLI